MDYAPLISNLPLLGHDDLAQNFRARINDAGIDSVAARRACEFLKDSLTSLAKSEAFTSSYEHSSQVVSRRVTTNEKTNDNGKRLKEVFGKNWKEVCAEMAKKELRYPKKFSQLSKQSQQEWWKTWNEVRASIGNNKNKQKDDNSSYESEPKRLKLDSGLLKTMIREELERASKNQPSYPGHSSTVLHDDE